MFLIIVSFLTNGFTQKMISGKVVDETGEALIGANVIEKGTENGTSTDIEGEFILDLITESDSIIIFYLGYKRKTFKAHTNAVHKMEQAMELICDPSGIIVITDNSSLEHTAPLPIQKLKAHQFKQDIDLTITPFINRVPGVYMHSGALNTNRITIRGIGTRSLFSTSRLRAYFNDIPLTSGDGETTIEDIDLGMIDEVQVYRGPTATSYGAGLGGMIHLKTRNLTDRANNHLLSSNTVGSYGLLRTTNTLTLGKGYLPFNMKLNINKTHSDGYRDNNEYDRQGASLYLSTFQNDRNNTSLLVNYIDSKAFIPSSLNENDYLNEPTKAAFTWGNARGNEDYSKLIFGVTNEYTISNNRNNETFSNKTTIFGNIRENDERRPFNTLIESSNSLGVRTTFDYRDLHQDTYFPQLSIGLEYYKEDYEWSTLETLEEGSGAMLSDNQEDRSYLNVFAQSQFTLGEKWSILTGFNINKTRYDYQDLFLSNGDNSGDYQYDWKWSPSISAQYQYTDEHQLFALISHGFSTPTLEETLTPDGVNNPDIQQEDGWNFELGAKGSKDLHKLNYEVSIYSMQVSNLLVAKRIAEDQFQGINAGRSSHTGVELYLDYRFNLRYFTINPMITYTYSHHRFDEFVDDDQDYSGNEMTGVAPHDLNIVAPWSYRNHWYGNFSFKYLSEMPMRDDNSIYSDAYSTLDAQLGYKYEWRRMSIDINGGIRNILNEQYASMILINAGSFGGNAPRYYYPGLPRNFYGNFRLNISL